ncbi:hypothetical protein AB0D08_00550 [Kitasatospora sp. NPDC048540]
MRNSNTHASRQAAKGKTRLRKQQRAVKYGQGAPASEADAR